MMPKLEIGDDVLVFSRYEGTVMQIEGDQVLIYCPDYDNGAPYLVTEAANVILLQTTRDTLIN